MIVLKFEEVIKMLRRRIENFLRARSDSKRRAENFLRRRKKPVEEDIDFLVLIKLFEGLEDCVQVNLEFEDKKYRGKIVRESGVTPQYVVGFMKEKFREYPGKRRYHYTDIQHEVFSGKKDERHYFNINEGWIKGLGRGPHMTKVMPCLIATIDYTIKKNSSLHS